MNTAPLKLELTPPFAVITFNQTDSKVNVLSREMWLGFKIALESLQNERGLHGLILRSEKPDVFLAGADLKELYPRTQADLAYLNEYMDLGRKTLDLLEALPFPTAALIDGVCLGGGLEVALACDLRIEGSNPKILLGFPEVNLGLIPGWGGTQRFSRLFDTEGAATLICTGKPMPSIFNWKIDSEKMFEASKSLLSSSRDAIHNSRLRKLNPVRDIMSLDEKALYPSDTRYHPAVTEALRVIKKGVQYPLSEALNLEREAFLNLLVSEGSQQLIGAFFNRKKSEQST